MHSVVLNLFQNVVETRHLARNFVLLPCHAEPVEAFLLRQTDLNLSHTTGKTNEKYETITIN